MNKNILTLILSVVVSVSWLYFFSGLDIYPECEGLACSGIAVIVLFVHFVAIPLAFGIFGFVLAPQHRLKQALSSLGISLFVATAVFLPMYIISTNEAKIRAAQDFQDMKARYEANPEEYKSRPY